MSLTVFLALCILGCDVLIYFLYEWAFGESNRIRKRNALSRERSSSTQAPGIAQAHPTQDAAPSARVIELHASHRNSRTAAPSVPHQRTFSRPNVYQERLAYRRLASSFAQLKPRT